MVNIDYLYNPEAAKGFFEKNLFVDKKLGFQVIEHGTVIPHIVNETYKPPFGISGIIDKEGDFVSGSHILNVKIDYTPPPNQFNIVRRLLFTLDYFPMSGVIQ